MRLLKNKFIFSPSDFVTFFESKFASYMDHFTKAADKESQKEKGAFPDPADPLFEIIAQMGVQHEKEVIQNFQKNHNILKIDKEKYNTKTCLQKTLSAMEEGVDLIYQGAISANNITNKGMKKRSLLDAKGAISANNITNKELSNTISRNSAVTTKSTSQNQTPNNVSASQLFGYVDILEKTKGASALGDYYYTPYDIKIAVHPSPQAIIQLCCYSDILGSIQKALPQKIKIITKDKVIHSFETKKFFYFYQLLKQQFLDYHSHFDSKKFPIPIKQQNHKNWNYFSKKILHSLDDISLTAEIRQSQCEKLRKSNINTMTELSNSSQTQIPNLANSAFKKLKHQGRLQVSSREQNKILFELLSEIEEGQGLESLPPHDPADIFFDMEGYPLLGEDGLEYLYGNIILEKPKGDSEKASKENPQYVSFWAKEKSKEATAFKNWLDWAYQLWRENPNLHIYHYGHYENSTLKRLMSRYGMGELQIDTLLRNEVFIDLYRVVKQGLRVGLHSYSLKEIEKLYYDKRETEIQSGGDSAVQFFHFLNSSNTQEGPLFLKQIEDYNKDDCLSTYKLCEFLWSLQKEHGILYKPLKTEELFEKDKSTKEDKPTKENLKQLCQERAEELLSLVPLEKRGLSLKGSEPKNYLRELLASLLEFHTREDKPGWWGYFEHFKKEEMERLEDRDIISSCRFIKSRGQVYEIKFEADQEFDFQVKDEVLILENEKPFESYKISELNLVEKTLCLKPTTEENIPKNTSFNLVEAKKSFYKNNLFRSLLETANNFSAKKPYFGLKKCIHDLLLKAPPDLPNHKGNLVINKENLISEASQHVLNLQDSILCIQGPPGSGKTYTAAHIILNLIQEGSRVGVTSNSHKAILNLLKILCEQNKNDIRFSCEKVCGRGAKEEEEKSIGQHPIKLVNKASKSAQVVGATAYFFSRDSEKEAYDYLFIDEASQLSLANTAAAGRSTRNIILLGDQNQLDQPIQAVHPGESGQSALSYYTDGQSAIPEDRGVFLPISYRLHPKICRFVSDNFYNGNLSPHPKNKNQKIILPESLKGKLADSGICFIPAAHSGNREASWEEVEALSYVYQELLKAKWRDKNKKLSPITTKDILITAPYNLQVSYIKRKLRYKGLRAASVDKFQGQEAPISIVSLSASTIQDAPRGISFLLNKNRLNVAISRAKGLSIFIGSKNLLDTRLSTLHNMELMNIWRQITCLKNS